MSALKKGLGRGFESLIPVDLLDETFDPTAEQDEKLSDLRHITIDAIKADPDQPRRSFEQSALEELAASIKEHGILQPIVVVPSGSSYQIVAGERRYRAAKLAGLTSMPAIVRTLSNQHKLEISLIENLQRRDLNAIETATAYLKLRDQFNLSLDQIGQRVGSKSASAISNTLRLLKLPQEVRLAIAEGALTEGQARPLIGQDEAFIASVLPRIITEDWSARKVEQFMVNAKNDATAASHKGPTEIVEGQHQASVQHLRSRLATDVNIRVNSRGAGQIVIKFKNDQDFERLQALLK